MKFSRALSRWSIFFPQNKKGKAVKVSDTLSSELYFDHRPFKSHSARVSKHHQLRGDRGGVVMSSLDEYHEMDYDYHEEEKQDEDEELKTCGDLYRSILSFGKVPFNNF